MNIFQCICGKFIQLFGEVDNLTCPNCGTKWEPNKVILFDGTIYAIHPVNGRWVFQETIKNKPETPVAIGYIWETHVFK